MNISFTNPRKRQETLKYVADQNGNRISFEHEPGRLALTKITDTQSRLTTFVNDPLTQAINSMHDVTGNRTMSYGRAANGNLETYTDAEGEVTTYEYNVNRDLTKITDPEGRLTTITYDPQGRVFSVKRGGDTTGYAYYDPTASFVGHGDGCSTDTPQGPRAFGQSRVTDPFGNVTYYCYDTHDRVYATFDDFGKPRETTFNNNDNVVKFTSPGGADFESTYDAQDRPERQTAPKSSPGQTAAAESRLCYGKEGSCNQAGAPPFYPVKSTDPQGKDITFGYDIKNNLTQINSTGLGGTAIEVNGDGTVKKVTDANNHPTQYTHTNGNLTHVTPPAPLGQISIQPDALSRTLSFTDGSNKTTSYSYDKLDRVTSAAYADGSTIAYVYDDNGNLTSRIDSATGTSSYGYDSKNRLISQLDPGTTTTNYGYDAADNLVTIAKSGSTTTNRFDDLNRLIRVDTPDAGGISFTYDDDDRRLTTTYPNAVTVTNSYDPAGHLLSTSAKRVNTDLSRFAYTYKDGTIDRDVRRTRTLLNGDTTTYSYDNLNRLTQAQTAGPGGSDVRQYVLDNVGNITQRTVNGAATNYSYNAANQLVGAGYDGAGNQTSQPVGGGSTTYGYNARNQMTATTPAGQAAVPLAYVGAGQDEPTQIGPAGYQGSIPRLTNDVLGIASETSAATPSLPEQTTSYRRDLGGTLLAQSTSSGDQYPITDGLGSITALTNAQGNVANSYSYDPYGQITNSNETVPNSFGFAGGFRSPGGLVHFNARYYNPSTGRWTQQDPLDQTGDLREGNAYGYAGADPVNLVDPTGRVIGKALEKVGDALGAGKRYLFSDKLRRRANLGKVFKVAGRIYPIVTGLRYAGGCSKKLSGGGLEGADSGSCNPVDYVPRP